MRRFFKSLSIFLLSAALVCPIAEGRGRNNNNGETTLPPTKPHAHPATMADNVPETKDNAPATTTIITKDNATAETTTTEQTDPETTTTITKGTAPVETTATVQTVPATTVPGTTSGQAIVPTIAQTIVPTTVPTTGIVRPTVSGPVPADLHGATSITERPTAP